MDGGSGNGSQPHDGKWAGENWVMLTGECVCSGTCEKPGTLTQGGAPFSLVPLVWEPNPKLLGGWCKPNHQLIMIG